MENLTIQGNALYYNRRHDVYRLPFGGDEPEWTTEIVEAEGFRGDIAPGRLFGAGDVLIATKGGRCWGFDRATGEQVWRQPNAFEDIPGTVAARPGRVYGIDYGSETTVAIDAATGAHDWTYEHDFPAFLSASNDAVVLGATPRQRPRPKAVALEPSGELAWSTPEVTNDATYDPPVVADGTVYGHTVGSLTAYDGDDGTELWSVGGLGQVSSVVVGQRSLFVGVDGDVYGLGPGG